MDGRLFFPIRNEIDYALHIEDRALLKHVMQKLTLIKTESDDELTIAKSMLEKCYLLYFLMQGEYQATEEISLWEAYKHENIGLKNSVFDYILLTYFRKPFEAGQYKQVIKAHACMCETIRDLPSNLVTQHERFIDFNKQLPIYLKIANNKLDKDIIPKKAIVQDDMGHTLVIEKTLNLTRIIAHGLLNDNDLKSNHELYEASIKIVNNELNVINLKNESDNSYKNATDFLMEFVFKSFPFLPPDKTQLIITKIKIIIAKENQNQIDNITSELSKQIIKEFDSFCINYPKFYKCYHDIYEEKHEYCFADQTLLKYYSDLTQSIEIIPKECIKILAHFHEEATVISQWIAFPNKPNYTLYQERVVKHHKLKQRDSDFKDINALYGSKNNYYEIDTDLNKIFNQIIITSRSTIASAIKTKTGRSVDTSKAENFFDAIHQYFNIISVDQFNAKLSKIQFLSDHTVAGNTLTLLRHALSNSERFIQDHAKNVISICQAIEPVLTIIISSKLVSYSDSLKMNVSLHETKMKASCALINQTVSESGKVNIHALSYIGAQYIGSMEYLIKHGGYEKDEKLEVIFHELIAYCYKNGNLEKMHLEITKLIIDKALGMFKENKIFQMDEAKIGYKSIEMQVVQIKASDQFATRKSTSEQLNNEIYTITIPPLTQNTCTHHSIIAEHKKICHKHQSLSKQLAIIKKDNSVIMSSIKKHQALSTQLDIFLNTVIQVSKSYKSSIIEKRNHCEQLKQLDAEIALLHQCLRKRIDKFKNDSTEFQNMKNQLLESVNKISELNLIKKNEDTQIIQQPPPNTETKEPIKSRNKKIKIEFEQRQIEEDLLSKLNSLENYSKNLTEERIKLDATINDNETRLDILTKECQELKNKYETERKNVKELKKKLKKHTKQVLLNNILLKGVGKPISLNSLNILNRLDQKLRSIGSKLIVKGSFTARIGIYCFNIQPELANIFAVNDIDIQIPFEKTINITSIIDILNEFEFNCGNKDNQYYQQFSRILDGINIDLTLIKSSEYISHEYLILRMGILEFLHGSYQPSSNPKIRFCDFTLELILPFGYEDIYKSNCQFKEFSKLEPNLNFKSYCYGNFNYLVKLKTCTNIDELLNQNGLFNELVGHFESLPADECYYEFKDFMIKGIAPENKQIAASLIKPLFFSLLKMSYPGLSFHNHEIYTNAAMICANEFINRCEIPGENTLTQDIGSIVNVVKSIAHNAYEKCYMQSSYQSQMMLQANPIQSLPIDSTPTKSTRV